jgi:hypothetical protein
MATSKNGAGGSKAPVTNSSGNVFSLQAGTKKVLKDGSDTSIPGGSGRELRHKENVIYAMNANGGWYKYIGTSWVYTYNPMGM